MSLSIIQTIQNNIDNLKLTKANIKNAVNTDYNFINNEQIESYPSLIKQGIAYYKNRIPHAIKEGTNLNFNAAPLRFDNMTIKGNTEQEQLSGKNLYGISDYEGTFKSVEVKIKDGEIMLNGTADSNGTLYIEPKNTQILNGTYMITNTFISGTQTGGGNINLRNASDNTVIDGTQLSFGDSVRKITLNNKNIKYGIYLVSGATFNSFKIKPQIVTGDVPDYDYEPYCGGQASPNPDYPQNIEVVTGNNTIKHTAKNKFDKNTMVLKGAIDVSNGVITANNNFTCVFIKCKPNTTYTIQKILSNRFSWGFSNSDNLIFPQQLTNFGGKNSATTRTVTSSNDSKYLIVTVSKTSEDTVNIDNILNSIQIEEGSTATPYEPYREEDYELNLGNIELCKIGDYSDVLFNNVVGDENYNAELEEGAWYKYKKIGKQIVDTNAMRLKDNYENIAYITIPKATDFLGYNAFTNVKVLCSHCIFKYGGEWDLATNEGYIFSVAQKQLFWVGIKKGMTLEEAKAKMNGIYIYYPISTPMYEKIIDQTLVSQLEALSKAKGNDGTTVITTDGEGLDPVLNFIAYLKEV